MSGGWVKLHRSLLTHAISGDDRRLAMWVRMLLKASHTDHMVCRKGQAPVDLRRGQILTSKVAMAEEFGMARNTLKAHLRFFQEHGMIDQQETNRYTLITLKNWDLYQTTDQPIDHQPDQQADHQIDHNQEGQEREEGKEKKKTPPSPPKGGIPGLGVDCDEFVKEWNALAEKLGLTEVEQLTKPRRSKIILRVREGLVLEALIPKIQASPFLLGNSPSGWKLTFDWLTKNSGNWVKVKEGNYDEKIDHVSGQPIEKQPKLEDYPEAYAMRKELVRIANACETHNEAKAAIIDAYMDHYQSSGMPGQTDNMVLDLSRFGKPGGGKA